MLLVSTDLRESWEYWVDVFEHNPNKMRTTVAVIVGSTKVIV